MRCSDVVCSALMLENIVKLTFSNVSVSVLFVFQQHSNASQSLCDIIRLSREQMIQIQDSPEPDQLLATLEK